MGIPLVALGVRPPQIENYQDLQARAAGIQNMRGQNALQPGQLQEQQNALKEQQYQIQQRQALNDAYKSAVTVDPNGQTTIDSDKLSKALSLSGHGSAIPSILEGINKFQESKAKLIEANQAIQAHQADLMGSAAQAIKEANYDPNLAHTILNGLGNSPQIQQLHKLIDANPQQFKQMIDTDIAQSPAQQKLKNERDVATIRASTQKEGELPLGDKVPQLNQGLARRFQVNHPGQAMPADYVLPANATQKDFDRIDKLLTSTEQATGVKANQDTTRAIQAQTHADTQNARGDARTDKSYQFSAGQLDKVGKPIEDAVARFGRLQDTLNQATPQADALVAPELLTVMAGGQGSGLRMNEAEISRIVGGRSHFEDLKAALNKWQLDPSKALSITPSQRGQIRALMNEVHGKLLQKQEILDSSREQLVNAATPEQHRKIITETHKKITQIDEGKGGTTSTAASPITATGPNGHKIMVKDGKWVDAQTGAPIQ